MNKATAKALSQIIKNEDVFEMLKRARHGVRDWTVVSKVNPCMSKGCAWNILAAHFDVYKVYHVHILNNILREFGEFLTIKPYMEAYLPKPKAKYNGEVCHKEPDFSNYD